MHHLRTTGILLLASLCLGILIGRAQAAHSRAVVGVAATSAPFGAPQDVRAGIPFTERDGNIVMICVADASGRTLPPFAIAAAVATP